MRPKSASKRQIKAANFQIFPNIALVESGDFKGLRSRGRDFFYSCALCPHFWRKASGPICGTCAIPSKVRFLEKLMSTVSENQKDVQKFSDQVCVVAPSRCGARRPAMPAIDAPSAPGLDATRRYECHPRESADLYQNSVWCIACLERQSGQTLRLEADAAGQWAAARNGGSNAASRTLSRRGLSASSFSIGNIR